MAKRTLDAFFTAPEAKKRRVESDEQASRHPTYPFPVPQLPPAIAEGLGFAPADEGKAITDSPDLDLLYFQPYIPKAIQHELFKFLRSELFFYRVQYNIKRGAIETRIHTPRYTTVFGVDETSFFSPTNNTLLLDRQTQTPIPKDRYKCRPRPIPHCLDALRTLTEASTGCTFNICLVNYYASGADSISFHSDDERFLGPDPAIASFTLGARRDFLLKHKPVPPEHAAAQAINGAKPLKYALSSGDMVLMRGATQSNWLHSIPKRKGGESDKGRINITFRRAMVKGGTENYYQYNVGSGGVFRWDEMAQEMRPWVAEAESQTSKKG